MWWIMTPKPVKSVRDRLHKAMPTSLLGTWTSVGLVRLYHVLSLYTRCQIPGTAEKVYNFIFNNKNLPEDLVPYWDFDAPNIPNELAMLRQLPARRPPFTS